MLALRGRDHKHGRRFGLVCFSKGLSLLAARSWIERQLFAIAASYSNQTFFSDNFFFIYLFFFFLPTLTFFVLRYLGGVE